MLSDTFCSQDKFPLFQKKSHVKAQCLFGLIPFQIVYIKDNWTCSNLTAVAQGSKSRKCLNLMQISQTV